MRFPFTRLLSFAIIVYYSNTLMNTSTVKIILCFLLIIPIMANAQSNDIQTWIERIGRQYAPDSRTAVYTVSSELLNDSIHILKGKCDNRQAVETLLRTLDTAGISYINAIKLLPDRRLGEKTRGIVTVCCAHLRSEPRHSAEMVSQAILGTPLLILEEQKGWYRVQTPDNYISWIIANSISVKTTAEWTEWKNATRYVYTGLQGYVYASADKNAETVSDIVSGCILQAAGKAGKKFIPVSFPDGRTGFLKHDECRELSEWASTPVNMNKIIQTAEGMMGRHFGQKCRLFGICQNGLFFCRNHSLPRCFATSSHRRHHAGRTMGRMSDRRPPVLRQRPRQSLARGSLPERWEIYTLFGTSQNKQYRCSGYRLLRYSAPRYQQSREQDRDSGNHGRKTTPVVLRAKIN